MLFSSFCNDIFVKKKKNYNKINICVLLLIIYSIIINLQPCRIRANKCKFNINTTIIYLLCNQIYSKVNSRFILTNLTLHMLLSRYGLIIHYYCCPDSSVATRVYNIINYSFLLWLYVFNFTIFREVYTYTIVFIQF